MMKINSRDALERNLDLLLRHALGREARPRAAARQAAWKRLSGKEREGDADRALALFAAGLVFVVAVAAAALAFDLALGPFATIVTTLVVLNLAAVPVAGVAIVLSRRHRYAEA